MTTQNKNHFINQNRLAQVSLFFYAPSILLLTYIFHVKYNYFQSMTIPLNDMVFLRGWEIYILFTYYAQITNKIIKNSKNIVNYTLTMFS